MPGIDLPPSRGEIDSPKGRPISADFQPDPPADAPLPPHGHDPVLMEEVLAGLSLAPGRVAVDCTLGRGGHACAIARRLGPDGLLIALDTDPRNLHFAAQRLATIPCRTRLFHANFARLAEVLREAASPRPNAILADLGLSTNQLFDERYGLSFATPAPLDMRLDPDDAKSAADLVNSLPETDLANVLYNLAQERYSRRIARKIVEARRISPILDTQRLAEIVRRAIPRGKPTKIDPATRTFLALRMAVNHEAENLAELLDVAPPALADGGRLAIISFQSMEDRAVKQAFAAMGQTGRYAILTKKPLGPNPDEIARNPRSRSARLRILQHI